MTLMGLLRAVQSQWFGFQKGLHSGHVMKSISVFFLLSYFFYKYTYIYLNSQTPRFIFHISVFCQNSPQNPKFPKNPSETTTDTCQKAWPLSDIHNDIIEHYTTADRVTNFGYHTRGQGEQVCCTCYVFCVGKKGEKKATCSFCAYLGRLCLFCVPDSDKGRFGYARDVCFWGKKRSDNFGWWMIGDWAI